MEGSPEPDGAGEYVIDVSEVWARPENSLAVRHFQLKHSSARMDQVITFSELENTLSGFAARFQEQTSFADQTFHIVCNRQVSAVVREVVEKTGRGEKIPAPDLMPLKKVTKLTGKKLKDFCAKVLFQDNQGDYRDQERELRSEVHRYVAGSLEDSEMMKLKALVESHALPHAPGGRERGKIHQEDVLRILGYTDTRELFPAPLAMEAIDGMFRREQHADLVRQISEADGPIIIRAAGGVGKSVVARQLADSFAPGSVGLVYDCFGGGNYLNESQPRHRPCDAMVQIANEMAVQSLCPILIAPSNKPVDAVLRQFLTRIEAACTVLQERNEKALLVLLIDAADNAVMAAVQQNDRCFATMLVRENYPSNCRVVLLCRPEREEMLKPMSVTQRLDLLPFSLAETQCHLRSHFPGATDEEGQEFCRLTGGNPRVQVNCLIGELTSPRKMLDGIVPGGLTVDAQIEAQLERAIASLLDKHTDIFKAQTEAICRGLATLPPFIPLPILAAAAEVSVDVVKSLIADLGRPLWHSDNAVQFRDEPTETWFRNTYAASSEQLKTYAESLQPLASQYAYVARALPALWHRAGEHDRLITLALSDDYLPTDSPMDETDIRVYRLQYALKAALHKQRWMDAAKLALRAGEAMAGNERKLTLFKDNLDLMGALKDAHRIQECAYKRELEGGWKGSANVFSASLLSMHLDFHGDARSYLHASHRFLHLHFEERDRKKAEDTHFGDSLQRADISELGWAHLGLEGPAGFVKFVATWTPLSVIFDVTERVVRRLIDSGRLAEVVQIAQTGEKYPHLIVALSHELCEVGLFPPKNTLIKPLAAVWSGRVEIKSDGYNSFHNSIPTAIVSFAEACAHHGLAADKIVKVLDQYATTPPSHYTIASDYDPTPRHVLARSLALKSVLNGTPVPEIKDLIPDPEKPVKGYDNEGQEERNAARRVLSALLSLYMARAHVIVQKPDWNEIHQVVRKQDFRDPDNTYGFRSRIIGFGEELSTVCLSILALAGRSEPEDLAFEKAGREKPRLWRNLSRRIRMIRVAYRHSHLVDVGRSLEKTTSSWVREAKATDPDERAGWYMALARAVLVVSKRDASAYFDEAIEAVSKFGDEMLVRWAALVSAARQSAELGVELPELAYRFVRCAEMIGQNVAREKHWNREDIFRVTAQLHAPSAFSALGRWRDRNVGWFDAQVEALTVACASNGSLSPSAAFCLTGFEGAHASVSVLRECVNKEPQISKMNAMFEMVVEDLYRSGSLVKEEQILKVLATGRKIPQNYFSEFLVRARRRQSRLPAHETNSLSLGDRTEQPKEDLVGPLLVGLDLVTVPGITQAVAALNSMKPYRMWDEFWKAVIMRIPHGQEVAYMETVLKVDAVDPFDMKHMLPFVWLEWGYKAAVTRHWPVFLTEIGRRFHVHLSSHGAIEYWRQTCDLNPEDVTCLQKGVLLGIEDSPSMLGCETLFGFVSSVTKRLTPADAREVLDYALGRFELHIPADFGDGEWQLWLMPPTMPDAFTGFLWAALGDPDSATRWEAAHCVRRLVELGCEGEILSLMGWLHKRGVEAFLGKGFPFYDLHARLYLLLGLARGALDREQVLAPYAGTLADMALRSVPHALIQLEAAKLALRIAAAAPGVLSAEVIQQLRQVGLSPFERRSITRDEKQDTPWHQEDKVAKLDGPAFGMDFHDYWLPGLGRVFGVLPGQVNDLMQEAAVNHLSISSSERYPEDPRREIWQSRSSFSNGTYHDHGDYPKVDDFHFYYSYHAFMITAARLLAAMPVILNPRMHEDEDDEPNRWQNWLKYHQLTRGDDRWLADRRDPTLPARVSKNSHGERTDWRWSIQADDFYDVLTAQAPLPGGLCVSGYWDDAESGYKENISITSVFIRREMIRSLANALRQHPEPNLHYLTANGHHQLAPAPFDLLHWIAERDGSDTRLDRADPHAKSLYYPPQVPASFICEQFHLTTDSEKRFWRGPESDDLLMVSEAWHDGSTSRHNEYYRYGERVFTSVPFLLHMCTSLERDLIFLVRMDRKIDYRRTSDDDGLGYIPSSHKVFTLSTDGILRDSTKNYQLG